MTIATPEIADVPLTVDFVPAGQRSLLQRMLSDRRPVGHFFSPEDETVRFHVNPRMGFPASEIQQLQVHNDAPADMMVRHMASHTSMKESGPDASAPTPFTGAPIGLRVEKS